MTNQVRVGRFCANVVDRCWSDVDFFREANVLADALDAGDAAIARVTELEVERDVQQGYRECMTDAAELLAAEVRRLRAMVLRMHAASVETNVFAGGWRAASLLRHYADGIESGRLP